MIVYKECVRDNLALLYILRCSLMYLVTFSSPGRRVPAPRLFCDICDVFDLHDTDDCPKQAMSDDSPPASSYHGNRHETRPYCDICESFGHWTQDCDDEQTF